MLTTVQVLAENNFGDTRTGGLAGPMGLLLIVALGTVTVLLIRNMNARLRRLPDRFPQETGPVDPHRADAAAVEPADGAGGPESAPDAPTGSQQGRNG